MRVGLLRKIALGICALVVGLMCAVLTIVHLSTTRAIKRKIESDLVAAQTVFEEFQRLRLEQLLTATTMLSEVPQLKAVITTPDIDHATLLDSAKAAQQLIHSDLLVLSNGEGRLLASVTEPTRFGDDVSAQPAFARALSGGSYEGVWANEGDIYQVVASPVALGDQVVGAIVTGFAIGRPLIHALEQMTNCQVALINPKNMVTSEASRALFDQLRQDLLSADKTDRQHIFTKTVNRERYMVLVAPFGGADVSDVLARSLLARSLDQELAFYRQLQGQVLLASSVILLVALLLGVSFSGKITQPIRALVRETQRIARGEFESQLTVSSSDELGELATAFNRMTSELKRLMQAEKEVAAQVAAAAIEKQRAEELGQANARLEKEIGERRRAEEALRGEKEALESMNRIMMNREERIMELKQEVNELLEELHRAGKYKSTGRAESPS